MFWLGLLVGVVVTAAFGRATWRAIPKDKPLLGDKKSEEACPVKTPFFTETDDFSYVGDTPAPHVAPYKCAVAGCQIKKKHSHADAFVNLMKRDMPRHRR